MEKIILNNVSVSYIVGDFSNIGLKDVIIQKLKGTYTQKEFLAVNHVSFTLEEGELLGIVGSNGAGKSTLLKVISGIMRPTEGTMAVNGNIASLLELGTGFDPDLTVKVSIACLVKPEILILDEVLSVGDGAFRKKSEEKMLEIIKGGATTLLVSHSIAQIRRMATKVLWLDKGQQIAFGDTKEICDRYEEFLNKK